jgi:hypothetical protein
MSNQQQPSARQQLSDQQRRDAERTHDNEKEFALKVNEAAIEQANLALRTAVLINGGAAVVVLGFVGALASHTSGGTGGGKVTFSPQLAEVASSLIWFAWGAFAGTAAMGFSYVTNYFIAERSWSRDRKSRAQHRIARFFHVIAVIGGIGSIGLFVFGMFKVRDAIASLAPAAGQ